MNRRKLLSSSSVLIGASLSGCLGFFSSDEEDDETPEPPDPERVDKPPYDITIPPNTESNWNPHYLGTNLESSPSINFSSVNEITVSQQKLNINDMEESNEYYAKVIDNESDMHSELNVPKNYNINFDENILLIIESGYGSSSLRHQWNRVEETRNGVHLHGYIYEPYDKNLDFSANSSVLQIERPNNTDDIIANISLTVDANFRVNFDSSEGVIGIEVLA